MSPSRSMQMVHPLFPTKHTQILEHQMEGFTQAKKMVMNHSFKTGGSVKARFKDGGSTDIKQDKAIAKKAIKLHDKNMHGGKSEDLSSLKKGGKAMKAGGSCYKKGGKVKPADASMKKGSAAVPRAPKAITKSIPMEEPVMAPASPLGGAGLATAAMKKGGKAKMKHGGDVKMKKGGMPKKYNTGGVIGAPGAGQAMTPQDLMMLKKKLAMMGGAGGAAGMAGGLGAAGMGGGAATGLPAQAAPGAPAGNMPMGG